MMLRPGVALAVLVGGLAVATEVPAPPPRREPATGPAWVAGGRGADPAIRIAQTVPSEGPALLEQLGKGNAAERRTAAQRLGEVGEIGAADGLARALHDPDAGVREAAASALWTVWSRSGDPAVDAILQQGISLTGEGRFADSVTAFSEIIRRAPRFAEGWNKRATVYYLMGELDLSLADCEEVIRLNPVHFGALSGFGLIYLQKDDLPRAAEYFERALAVNPDLGRIRTVLDEIRAVLAERRRQSI